MEWQQAVGSGPFAIDSSRPQANKWMAAGTDPNLEFHQINVYVT
jgi:hypothetical protein